MWYVKLSNVKHRYGSPRWPDSFFLTTQITLDSDPSLHHDHHDSKSNPKHTHTPGASGATGGSGSTQRSGSPRKMILGPTKRTHKTKGGRSRSKAHQEICVRLGRKLHMLSSVTLALLDIW